MVLKAPAWSLAHRSNQGEARTMMFDMAGSDEIKRIWRTQGPGQSEKQG